jgi:hypothetical protein
MKVPFSRKQRCFERWINDPERYSADHKIAQIFQEDVIVLYPRHGSKALRIRERRAARNILTELANALRAQQDIDCRIRDGHGE